MLDKYLDSCQITASPAPLIVHHIDPVVDPTDNYNLAVSNKFIAVLLKSQLEIALFTLNIQEKVFEPQSGNLVKSPKFPFQYLLFSPFNDNLLVTSTLDGAIQMWQVFDGVETCPLLIKSFKAHCKKLSFMLFHTSVSDLLITGSGDLSISFWDLKIQKVVKDIQVNSIPTSLALSFDGSRIAIYFKDQRIIQLRNTFDLNVLSEHQIVCDKSKTVRVLNCGQMNQFLVTAQLATGERIIYILDKALQLIKEIVLSKAVQQILPIYDDNLKAAFLVSHGGNELFILDIQSQIIVCNYEFDCQIRGFTILPQSQLLWKQLELARFYYVSTKRQLTSMSLITKDDKLFTKYQTTTPSLTMVSFLKGQCTQPQTCGFADALRRSDLTNVDYLVYNE